MIRDKYRVRCIYPISMIGSAFLEQIANHTFHHKARQPGEGGWPITACFTSFKPGEGGWPIRTCFTRQENLVREDGQSEHVLPVLNLVREDAQSEHVRSTRQENLVREDGQSEHVSQGKNTC